MTRSLDPGFEGHDAVCLRSIREVVDVFGGKWSLLVVEQLHAGTMRFNELSRSIGVGTKSLTDSLRRLEENGIVSRTVRPTVPVTVEYSLTDKGRDFDSVLLAMKAWCARWPPEAEGAVAVRAAGEDDLPDIMRIIGSVKEEFGASGIPMWQRGYPDEALIREEIGSGRARVAVHAGRTVGYMLISFGPEPHQSSLEGSWAGSRPSSLHRFAVDPGFRRRRAGTTMLASWESEARGRGCDSLRTETMEQNRPMVSLLGSAGFASPGRVTYRQAHPMAFEKIL